MNLQTKIKESVKILNR